MAEGLMNFRVDADLKKDFAELAKSRDMTSSQLLRNFMRTEVEKFNNEKSAEHTRFVKGKKNARRNR